ncbi:MAG: hypothetical protein DNFNHJIP_00166 [Candidatus Argoarchaeum ethanivorans]|uniref:DUF2325 domain-containing protein n=1 Tax=Candidatus Argoarchaeum ethanivorans TaxID=2608793 RepID=A0A811ZZE9_9EURY|nr:MAG: hypothetical protein DNFNHJIP_00166 [Candidatus Argoarchaeum ethanivorans]
MAGKRIWEMQPFTVCRILGLAFNEMELSKIFRELKLSHNGDLLQAAAMHQQLINVCTNKTQASRSMDTILNKRFEPYKEKIKNQDIVKLIEHGKICTDIPLPAFIWFAVQDQRENDSIEEQIIAAIHIKEHEALRFYDELSRTLHNNPECVLSELNNTCSLNERLEKNLNRLKKRLETVRSEMDAMKESKLQIIHALQEMQESNEQLKAEMGEAKNETAPEQIKSLKKERDFLIREVKQLTEKLGVEDTKNAVSENEKDVEEMPIEESKECPYLTGVKVMYIGGVEPLAPHYRGLVESFGCNFCYHPGHCPQKSEIRSIVGRTDMVFCPVDINSHNACRHIKKACKQKGIPCFFLRSSGVTTLKKSLEDHLQFTAGSLVSQES